MAIQKCSLSAVDGGGGARVEAFLNPKEFQVDKTVPWAKHPTKQNDAPTLEFTHAEPKSLAVELLFDTYESGESLRGRYLEPIETMSKVDEALGRPPKVLFQWGDFKFYGAIESVSIKYTMFKDDGTACRAVVNVKMKEAERLQAAGSQGAEGGNQSEQEAARQEGRNADLSDDAVHDTGTVIPRG